MEAKKNFTKDLIEVSATREEWQEIVYDLVGLEGSEGLTPAATNLLDLFNKFGVVG